MIADGLWNTRISGEKIMIYDYPDGTLAFKYGHRTLAYQVFDKLAIADQGARGQQTPRRRTETGAGPAR